MVKFFIFKRYDKSYFKMEGCMPHETGEMFETLFQRYSEELEIIKKEERLFEVTILGEEIK